MIMAAATTTGCGSTRAFPKSPSSLYQSEKDDSSINEASSGGGRPGSKEISNFGSSFKSSAKCNSSCIATISSSSSLSSSSTLSSAPSRSESVGLESSDAAARTVLRLTTRSLPVSFQGESFFFQTKKAKPTPRKLPTIECREANVVGIENSQSDRWPATRAREPKSTTSSLDCSSNKEHSLLVTVRFLHHSLLFDEVVNFNIGDRTQSLDSEIVSSGSNSSSPEPGFPVEVQAKPPGVFVPARFRQEKGCPQPHAQNTPKMLAKKQQTLSTSQLASPRFVSSPPCEPNSSSPKDIKVSRIRRNIMDSYSNGSAGNAPSIINFASEVRRRKKGESRIEDAHLLRLLHNRYLQWRYINARAENTISIQMMNTQNQSYYAWMTFSELHGSVMNRQINLQVLRQNLKLASILMGQIVYLDKWSTLDEGHEISFKGAIDALKASTLRLPVIGGAKVDIKEVKDALNSAVGVMQAMMVSVSSLLSKVERTSSLVSELGKLAAHEWALLNHYRDLMSIVAALHVKQSSLQSYLLQLLRNKK